MKQDQDFSALRNLLALKKLETPLETDVDRFLIELHRRQRAQLLVPESAWDRVTAWVKEQAENLGLVPSLSYAGAFAAVALTLFFSLTSQVTVTDEGAGQYKLSLHAPTVDTSFAMLPVSMPSAAKTDSLSFTPVNAGPSTRFVLANNSRTAYDATAAF